MKLQTRLAFAFLFLFLVLVCGFGGCSIGSHIGHARDVKNGSFGKGLEGSENEFGFLLLGWALGILAGIVIFFAVYRVLRRRFR